MIYWLRSLRNTHTRKHSRNPGSNSSQAHNKELIVKTKRKPWPCLVMKLNFITIAWNFGFLEYSSSHSRGINAKIWPRKNYKINLFKFPVLHTRCFTEWWSVVALEVYSGDSVICHSSSWLDHVFRRVALMADKMLFNYNTEISVFNKRAYVVYVALIIILLRTAKKCRPSRVLLIDWVVHFITS